MYPIRRLTPSGSRVTSTPPTIALPDVGSSKPHNIRMVVDLPAPLLPRKPKISPRRTSKVTRSTATNWPNRRVSSRTAMAAPADGVFGGSAANRPLQACFGETNAGQRARTIEFSLQSRDLRVEHVGARGHAGGVALANDALGLPRGAHFVLGRDECLPRGLQFEAPRAHLEGDLPIEIAEARLQCGRRGSCFAELRGAAAAVPQRPADVHRRVPRGSPIAAARKDAGVGAGIVVAAAEGDLRTTSRRDRRGAFVRGARTIFERAALGTCLDRAPDQLGDLRGGSRRRGGLAVRRNGGDLL